ncbi:MAG: hypothetical protein ACI4L1_03845 [Christensenellales bacterium]
MKFELWSPIHYVIIALPAVLILFFWLLMRKRSQRAKDIVGIMIGSLSIIILIARNGYLLIAEGFSYEIIPLQVCQIGSLIVGLALITKKRALLLMGFCFHLVPAYGALIFANSLLTYPTLVSMKSLTFILGHITIIVGSAYGILVYRMEYKLKHFIIAFILTLCFTILSVVFNSLFRYFWNGTPNYFYLYNADLSPFEPLFKLGTMRNYGWFSINWEYACTLIAIFIVIYVVMYFVAKLFNRKVKSNKKQSYYE